MTNEMFKKEAFKKSVKDNVKFLYRKTIEEATQEQIFQAVSYSVKDVIIDNWLATQKAYDEQDPKIVYYMSMEFLMGRALGNNLINLCAYGEVKEALEELGFDLNCIEDQEPDPALGNGGLGRLAACFLDSLATLNYAAYGCGIRYHYGMFKQKIENGYQIEVPDNWLKNGYPFELRRPEYAKEVHFGGYVRVEYDPEKGGNKFIHEGYQAVKAIPYDMPITGYDNDVVNTLRIWDAEPIVDFELDSFDKGDYKKAVEQENLARNIVEVLYPNDNHYAGKELRLKQQYFFCAASLHDLLKKHLKAGRKIEDFAEYNSIQLNDTHPTISIPELIRLLMTEYGVSFEKSLEIAQKTFNYTNHTIMPEALEKWGTDLMEELLPQVYSVILRINEAFIADMYRRNMPREQIDQMKMVSGGVVHMAKMAIYCSSCTNGVARIHTEILKHNALPEWYELYPERFQNKTNGITPRRWIALCNPELSAQITDLLGDEGWITDLSRLKELEKYAGDPAQLDRFSRIKSAKKATLAEYIAEHDRTAVDADSIFDIQIKRLHEYKRQLLNAFSIMYIYFGIKDGSIKDFYPTTFIFGAKSAPGYARAKAIIKYINEIAALVNSDPAVKGLINVVFVQNYNVSYAEKLVTAADISEQISTAGTEASGTGNMKFMLNGTVTLGTYDGANVEIAEEAGIENNYIFGARVEELEKIMPSYDPRKIYASDPQIARVLDTLIDGTFSDGGSGAFRELYYALLDGASWHVPDHYYLLGDLHSYVEAKLKANADYRDDRAGFLRKCWINMSNAGKFSSDRTIADYAKEIWRITPDK